MSIAACLFIIDTLESQLRLKALDMPVNVRCDAGIDGVGFEEEAGFIDTHLDGGLSQLLDFAQAVKQGEVTVDVQVNKVSHRSPSRNLDRLYHNPRISRRANRVSVHLLTLIPVRFWASVFCPEARFAV